MDTGDVHPFETAVVDALDDEGGVSRLYYNRGSKTLCECIIAKLAPRELW